MSKQIVLDTGPLGMVTHPKGNADTKACAAWLVSCLQAGAKVCVPEICDYELRRELIRAKKTESVARLDAFLKTIVYIPIGTEMMRKAAELWAQSRSKGGTITAPDEALDGDVILAAQAVLSAEPGRELCIATTNVGHLAQFADARPWKDIQPS